MGQIGIRISLVCELFLNDNLIYSCDHQKNLCVYIYSLLTIISFLIYNNYYDNNNATFIFL